MTNKMVFLICFMFIGCVLLILCNFDKRTQAGFNRKKLISTSEGRRPTVLVACGSFSPITNAHLRMLENARDHLQLTRPDLTIVGGFISPVGDAYEKKGLIAAHHRVAMAHLALNDSSWVHVDSWESQQPTFQRTLIILKRIQQQLIKHYKRNDVRVLLVCGTDLLESFNIPDLWSTEDQHELTSDDFGIVLVQRKALDVTSVIIKNDILWKNQKNIFVVPLIVEDNISSTLVRSMIKRKMSVKYLIPCAVVDYIKHNKLYLA